MQRFSYLEKTHQVSVFDFCINFETIMNLYIKTNHSLINLSNIVHSLKGQEVTGEEAFHSCLFFQEPIYLSIYPSIYPIQY